MLVTILAGVLLLSSCGEKAGKPAPKARGIVIKNVASGSLAVDGKVDDWDREEIEPLDELAWQIVKFFEAKPSAEEERRIKTISLAHDGLDLYILLEIEPGIEEFFEETGRSGHVGYIFIDCDGKDSTGGRATLESSYLGWDYRIYLPTGFTGSTASNVVNCIAGYQIEKIEPTSEDRLSCRYEEVADGGRGSRTDPSFIAFDSWFLEFRIPFEILEITPMGQIRFLLQDLSTLPSAQTEFAASLE